MKYFSYILSFLKRRESRTIWLLVMKLDITIMPSKASGYEFYQQSQRVVVGVFKFMCEFWTLKLTCKIGVCFGWVLSRTICGQSLWPRNSEEIINSRDYNIHGSQELQNSGNYWKWGLNYDQSFSCCIWLMWNERIVPLIQTRVKDGIISVQPLLTHMFCMCGMIGSQWGGA